MFLKVFLNNSWGLGWLFLFLVTKVNIENVWEVSLRHLRVFFVTLHWEGGFGGCELVSPQSGAPFSGSLSGSHHGDINGNLLKSFQF